MQHIYHLALEDIYILCFFFSLLQRFTNTDHDPVHTFIFVQRAIHESLSTNFYLGHCMQRCPSAVLFLLHSHSSFILHLFIHFAAPIYHPLRIHFQCCLAISLIPLASWRISSNILLYLIPCYCIESIIFSVGLFLHLLCFRDHCFRLVIWESICLPC